MVGLVGTEDVVEDVLEDVMPIAPDEECGGLVGVWDTVVADAVGPPLAGGVCGRELGSGGVGTEVAGGIVGLGPASTARGSSTSPTAQAAAATTEPATIRRTRARRRARTAAHSRSR
ncbi:hypothetical protein [Catenulispora sp. GP43]|uniref:hypothetical protein n=1 Tax=Catenulispora sp. GP43 TaxID=3156263 RepID=UPI003515452E